MKAVIQAWHMRSSKIPSRSGDPSEFGKVHAQLATGDGKEKFGLYSCLMCCTRNLLAWLQQLSSRPGSDTREA